MRGLIIAGNWKLNGLIDEALSLVKAIEPGQNNNIEVVVAPPYTAIYAVKQLLSLDKKNIFLSGQDIFWEAKGAYTGKISPSMLVDAGCSYAIIGHSERRQYFHETNESVNKKVRVSLQAKLKCIVCVGETLEQREKGDAFSVIESQLKGAFDNISSKELEDCVIAYEPVWAIGTGKTATPEQADEVHKFIREKIENIYNQNSSNKIKILYGGSVNEDNAEGLLSKENIDGGLIGGASLRAESFNSIIRAGEKQLR